jgi:hypothetical protein
MFVIVEKIRMKNLFIPVSQAGYIERKVRRTFRLQIHSSAKTFSFVGKILQILVISGA